MFLPGRSIDDEKQQRNKIYQQIEQWCISLILNETIQQSIMISIQEVKCGDPTCAPIDTIVSISFPSGGQGMFGLPMEPKDVTKEILEESFPPDNILQAWMDGEDAEWPPILDNDDMNHDTDELRFTLGASVICRTGPNEWLPGTISKLWYRESQWPNGAYAPYQIVLDDGRAIFAPFDNDQVIRLNPNATTTSNTDGTNNDNDTPST